MAKCVCFSHQRMQNSRELFSRPGNWVWRINLFSHGTLICVSWGLIMMRIWNETSNNSQYCERLNLQVCCLFGTKFLIESNQAVILLIHIQIFDDSPLYQVLEAPFFAFDLHAHRSTDMICQNPLDCI